MRRLAIFALALAFAAPACDDDSPNGPSSGPIVFTAQLTSAAEVPAIPNTSEAGGSGSATITLNVPRDSSGNPTAGGTANFQYSLTGFPNGTTIILAHIHIGAAGVSGGIRVNTGLSQATAVILANGSGLINATDATVSQADAQGIVANPAGYYFNVHSSLNPGGVVRGQLVRVQ
jgi:hypothetical protein